MTKTRIMAIDDEPGVTRLIKLNLETTGRYEVCTVNEPESALSEAHEFKPDLILLDVMMPNMHGGEVAEQIDSDPMLKNIPIVYLTAIVTRQEAGAASLSRAGRRVVAKPIGLNALTDCIEATLQDRRIL